MYEAKEVFQNHDTKTRDWLIFGVCVMNKILSFIWVYAEWVTSLGKDLCIVIDVWIKVIINTKTANILL